MKIYVDTNIFLRFLLADNPKQSPSTKRLFKQAEENKLKLITHSIIIAEIIWTLDSFYKQPKKEIVKKLKKILSLKALEVIDREALISALSLYEDKNMDFIDAFSAAWMKKQIISQIYSFDRDFDKIEGIRRKQP